MLVNKRRNYLINKNFQFKFILYTLIPSLFSLTIFYICINFYFSKLIAQGKNSGLQLEHPYFALINDHKIFMNSLFLIGSFFLLVFFCIWGLIISHKIAGPLYRLTKFFEDINSQEFKGKISFRPGDFFQEIPAAINKWMKVNYHPEDKSSDSN